MNCLLPLKRYSATEMMNYILTIVSMNKLNKNINRIGKTHTKKLYDNGGTSMYQQVNLTLLRQCCSGKMVSSYSGLRGFDSQCGCS